MHPETLTLEVFSRYIGRASSWVAHLKKNGRLVLTDDGRVRVGESLSLIADTAAGLTVVAERHELARRAKREIAEAPPDRAAQLRAEQAEVSLRLRRAQAEAAELERDKQLRELVSREDAIFVIRHIGACVRAEVEAMADRLAPIVAPVADLEAVRDAIESECRAILFRVAEAIGRGSDELDKTDDRPSRAQ